MHRCEAPFGSGRRDLFVLDRLRAPVRVPLLSVLVGLITIVGLITMLPSENPTALGLPSKLKVSRTARSSRRSKRTGGDDDADGVDAVMVKDTEGRTIIPLPAGARCDTCPFQDCDEDPSIKKMREELGEEQWLVQRFQGPWIKTLWYDPKRGIFLCWWKFDKKTGLPADKVCGYCSHIYYGLHRLEIKT